MGTLKVDTVTNVAGSGAPDATKVTVGTVELSALSQIEYAVDSKPSSPSNGSLVYLSGPKSFQTYFDGYWHDVAFTFPPVNNGARGVFFAGAQNFSPVNRIDYFDISTTGNAATFGNANVAVEDPAGCSDGSRGVFAGGSKSFGTGSNEIQYITVATASNATDFGDDQLTTCKLASVSDGAIGLFAGGYNGSTSMHRIRKVTIQTLGNATNHGDLTNAYNQGAESLSGAANLTRGLFFGGMRSGGYRAQIDYITIATGGTANDFGDLTVSRAYSGAFASSSRAVVAGGATSGLSVLSPIDYVEIMTTSNASDFGDLISARWGAAGCGNGVRGVFGAGYNYVSSLEYVTIAVPSNAATFGNLTLGRYTPGAYAGD